MAAYPEQVYQCQSCLFKTSSITIIGDHVENCTGTATIAHDAAQEESLDAVQDFLTRHQDDETLTILAQDGHDAGDSQSVHAWPAAATLLLIDSFRKHQDDFNHPNKKKNAIWKDVAKEMQGEGYAVDAAQCDNKMRSLKKRYKLIKDKASKTGQGAMRPWQFFNAMDDLLSGDPTIRPIALKSSLPFASTSTAATPSCVGGQGSSTSGLQPTKISVGVPSPTGIQSPAPSPLPLMSPNFSSSEPPSPLEQRPKRRRTEGASNVTHALLESQDKAFEELLTTSKDRNTSINNFINVMEHRKSSSEIAVEDYRKDKEDLTKKVEDLYEVILRNTEKHVKEIKENNERHQSEMKEIIEKCQNQIKELNEKHQSQIQELSKEHAKEIIALQTQHQEQLVKLILSKNQ